VDVWYAIPTKKQPHEVAEAIRPWQDMGYKVALFRDIGDPQVDADLVIKGVYTGYPNAVNALCRSILSDQKRQAYVQFIVTGGDDMFPDPDADPQIVAEECIDHFGNTFGVMQPTGDNWMVDENGVPACAKICGSPWMGREFIERINGGEGPIWHEYFHFFEDQEMLDVTQKLGILWQRKDLVHYHNHWLRQSGIRERPAYLQRAQLNWNDAKILFERRKAAGFPGHEPLPELARR
jgi:hypothetical protein